MDIPSSHAARPHVQPTDELADEERGPAADAPGDQEREPVAADAPADVDEEGERYRLVSIESVRAPAGCVGRDWFVYRISQGENGITGYRRGSRETVSAEVETIVAGLNGRRQWSKSKSDAKAARRAATARRKSAE